MPAREITARVILCSLVLTAAALHGGCAARTFGKPWLKPPEQWGSDDAKRIWSNSPWVCMKKVISGSPDGPTLNFERMVDSEDPSRAYTLVSWSDAPTTVEPVTNEYRIRWISSKTMCLANQGRNSTNPPRVDSCSLGAEVRILVDRLDGFSTNEFVLSQRSYLLPGKLGVKVEPISVEHALGSKIVFVFPGQTSDGRPVIQSDETSVEFTYSDGRKKWRVKFKPQEMVGPTGRDL